MRASATAASGITYHGRILKPDGTALESMNVQFKVQIRTGGSESCVMFEELQNLNMRSTGGVFSVTINDGTGTRQDTSGYTIDQVFQNRGVFAFPTATCQSGSGATTNWSPNAADGRKIKVTFRDENMSSWEPLPDQMINFVPMAIEAKQVGGFTPQHLLRVDDAAAVANASPLTLAQFTEFQNLLSGSSTQFVKSNANGVVFPNRATDPATPAAGQIWYDTSTNQLKYYNGSASQTLGAGGGALPALPAGQLWVGNGSNVATAVTASGDATLGSSGAIALKNTGTAGTYFRVSTDAQGRVTSGVATLAESDIPTLSTAGKVSGSAITGTIGGATILNTSGAITTTGNLTATNISATAATTQSLRVFNTGNTHFTSITVPAGLANDFSFVLPSTAGSNGYVLTTDGTGTLSWTAAAAGSVVSVGGTAPIVIGGTASAPIVTVTPATTAASGVVTLAANNGTTASTVVQATDSRLTDARAPSGAASGDLGGTYPAPSVLKIRGAAVGAATPVTGQVLRFGASSYDPTYVNFADLRTALGATQIPTTCTAAQTWSYSSVSDTFTCANISVNASQVAGLGTAAAKNIPSSGNASPTEVVYGTDTRLSDARAPSGAAGGDLAGTYPNPTLSTTGVTAGTYPKVTVDVKGRVSAGAALVAADVPVLDWTKITTGKPTTLTGYGITDALVANAGAVPSVASGLDASKGTAATAGRVYVATDTKKIYRDNGSSWDLLTSLAFSDLTGSVSAAQLPATGLGSGDFKASGSVPMTGAFQAASGTAAAPGISFAADTDTGFYSVTNDTIGLATNGVNRWNFNGLYISGNGVGSPLLGLQLQTPGQPAYSFNGSGTTGMYMPVTNDLAFSTAGTERVRILAGGNVGIGIAAPATKLDVADAVRVSSNTTWPSLTITSGGAGYQPSLIFKASRTNGTAFPNNGDWLGEQSFRSQNDATASRIIASATEAHANGKAGSAIAIWTAPNGSDVSTERFRVDHNGNVGIGTTTPGASLHVVGSAGSTLKIVDGNQALGKVLTSDANGVASWATLPAGGTVTSVTSTTTDIAVGGTAAAPALTLNSGVGANQILKLDGSAQIPAVSGALLTSLNASNLGAGSVPAARMPAMTGDVTTSAGAVATTLAAIKGTALTISGLATSDTLKYNGTAWINGPLASTELSDGANLLKATQMPANCTANQTLTFSSPTGTWICSAILVDGSAFGSQTAKTVLVAPTGSAGTPTFRALVAGDLPSLSSGQTGTLPITNGGSGSTTGSITGSSALTFTAGGTDQNITLQPSGAGNVLITNNASSIGLGTTTPVADLNMVSSAFGYGGTYYGATMSAAAGSTTATLSAPIAVRAGDVLVPYTTSQQSRVIFVTETTSAVQINPSEPYSIAVTSQNFYIYRPYIHTQHGTSTKFFVQGYTGRIGVGNPYPQAGLDVNVNFSNRNNNGVRSFTSGTNSIDGTYSLIGLQIGDLTKINAGITNSGTSQGLSSSTLRNYGSTGDSGTLAEQQGGNFTYGHFATTPGATPQTTKASGLIINPYIMTGTIGNMYDLTIENTAGGGTISGRHFGLYQKDPSVTNYFSGNVGIGTDTPMYNLHVNGSVAGTSAYNNLSDRRLKKNFSLVTDSLTKLNKLNGVTFDWRANEYPEIKFEPGRDMGVIAQEVETVFPEAVHTDQKGFKTVAYSKLIAPLIEAVKSLFATSQSHADEIANLKKENAQLKGYLCAKDPAAPFCP